MPAAGIDTPLSVAHFLGQAAQETAGFTRLTENLVYTHAEIIAHVFPALEARAAALVCNPVALANAAYANRWGNGNEASGDGWRYRGRGLFGHTFRDNYSELASALDRPLLSDPDLLLDPTIAVRAAAYFFRSRGCIDRSGDDDTIGITKKINGGLNGFEARLDYKKEALRLLSP